MLFALNNLVKPATIEDKENSFTQDNVKLSVGGKWYEVSRSFIERQTDTLLARLITGEWNDDPSKVIFIN